MLHTRCLRPKALQTEVAGGQDCTTGELLKKFAAAFRLFQDHFRAQGAGVMGPWGLELWGLGSGFYRVLT